MRSCLTAVLEKHAVLETDLVTEPYEAPWAGEVRFFVHTLELATGTTVDHHTEISPDGLHWCDSGLPPTRTEAAGLVSWPVTGFGQWLRLRCVLTGSSPTATVRIYLVGKS